MNSLEEVINDAMNHLGIKEKVKEQKLFTEWEDIVGEKLAEICLPKEIKNGIIFLECPSPVWMQELSFRRREIIKKINKKFNYRICNDVKIVAGSTKKFEFEKRENPVKNELEERKEELISLSNSEKEWIDSVVALGELEEEFEVKLKKILEKDIKLKKKKISLNYSKCEECGRSVEKNTKICLICRSYFTRKRIKSIINLLKDVPWISKGELEKYFPNLTNIEYNRAKKKARDEVVDEVYRAYFAYKRIKSKENYNWLKNSLNNYILVISKTKPKEIDEKKREKNIKALNENIYKLFYNKE